MNQFAISIAVVDDDPLLRKCFVDMCSRNGIEVVCEAGNGVVLLAQLARAGVRPDVCLLDVQMPCMDGYETAIQLKLLYPAINILAHSTNSDSQTRQRILKCGADMFIAKGTSTSRYVAAIRSLCTTGSPHSSM